MILMYKCGKVETHETDVEFPRFRIPVSTPRRVEWIQSEGGIPMMKEPTFHQLEFHYITTVDDHRVYREVTK